MRVDMQRIVGCVLSQGPVAFPRPISTHDGDTGISVSMRGNVAMSSCPGKNIRLDTGPVNGRAMVARDVHADFARAKLQGVTHLVCLLDDAELALLGIPWPKYAAAAEQHNMPVIRFPMADGAAPDIPEDIEPLIAAIDQLIRSSIECSVTAVEVSYRIRF